ncbi:Glucosamine 6-phosphate N-acetyltransferase [Dirofilaria immitis]
MDEMMRLSRRLKNLKTTEEKLRQFPAKSDFVRDELVYKIGYVLRSVKHIVASATLFPEFKFTHEAGCLGRIGDVIVNKTVLDLYFPKILYDYLISLARRIDDFLSLAHIFNDTLNEHELYDLKKFQIL